MAWEIVGYTTRASAPVQDAAVLNPGTASQSAMTGTWVNNAGTVSATVTLTLSSGVTIPAICPVGTSIWPTAATNYTTAASDITVYNVRTT